MMAIFSIFAKPLGLLMSLMYDLMDSYFLTILVFTVLVRLCMFPLSLHSQKTQAERARLAPRLERLQKKYGKDQQKLMEKQQELYQKEGVKMTAGCLPSIIQMLVLMSVIAVIYKPLTYLENVPTQAIEASITAVAENIEDEKVKSELVTMDSKTKEITGVRNDYYSELRLLRYVDDYPAEVKTALSEAKVENVDATYEKMSTIRKDFSIFGLSLLEAPWQGSFTKINWLWMIALLSGLTALGTSLISMHFMKAGNPDQQPGQGCMNGGMMFMMPLISLFISFSVPGGVGLYWILSNLLSIVQTIVLNIIYNPAKIRAQAYVDYEERRRRKKEDKKRLAEARAREDAALAAEKQAEQDKKVADTKKSKKENEKTHLPSSTTSADAEEEKE